MQNHLKTVYFVRHAQTDGNAGDIQMADEAMLTEIGLNQADSLAKKLQHTPFDICFSSPTQRAVDTANIILKYHPDLKIHTQTCLVERKRPSSLIGINKNDPLHLRASAQIYDNFHIPGHRFGDEENFEDLDKRAEKVLELINNCEGKSLLVVTHGYFMRIVAAKLLFEDDLDGMICKQFVRTMHLENTGICQFNQDQNQKWWLWRWNDHSHLQ